jgi:hypothetical protein
LTLYWWAGIAIALILIGSILARAIPGFVFICTRDGTTMVSAPGKYPSACRHGHRLRMLFPASAYAAMMAVGDLAMCTLIAHFILQPYIPSALPFIIVLAALGIVGAVKDLVTIPATVRAEHQALVRRHYIGALIGHAVALIVMLRIDWRTI